MGTITVYKGKRGTTYRAAVCVDRKRSSETFDTRGAARAWIQGMEAGDDAALPDKTVKSALIRYSREVSPGHKGERWEHLRLNAIAKQTLSGKRLAALSGVDLADWRDERLGSVAPATVLREMNLLHSVFEACHRDWGWLRANPLAKVRRPKQPPSRKRRISAKEIAAILAALGYAGGKPETISQRIAIAFLFALETAMRAGEILGLKRADLARHSVKLPKTKNGDAREVALSTEARRLLKLLPKTEKVFDLEPGQRDSLFRKARDKTGLDLHFHDARAEAIWRLSKKLDIMELATMIGHRDLKSLLIYYSTSPAELAAKLG